MRMSCNGCRVLRKGCSESCSIRPCLQWIKSPDAQAHATVFLAKFYGRAGLLNLINSGPSHLRPAIFKSLLYEACGRIVSPIYGSVGLLWSGSWPMVQAAVDAVLNGAPIVSVPSDGAAAAAGPGPGPGLQQSYDIRHVFKSGTDHADPHKVSKTTRTRFKRTAKSSKVVFAPVTKFEHEHDHERSFYSYEHCRGTSVDTHDAASHVSQCEPTPAVEREDRASLDLTLGLGLEPVKSDVVRVSCKPSKSNQCCESSTGACKFNLLLQLCALEQQTF